MSTFVPTMRAKAPPRSSVVNPVGTRALEPAPTRGLLGFGATVGAEPPTRPSGASSRLAPNATLLALLPERLKPLLLPMALKLALTVRVLEMSGDGGPELVFP